MLFGENGVDRIDVGRVGSVTRTYVTRSCYMVYNRIQGSPNVKQSDLCPVETTTRIAGGRWKGAVLEQLFDGAKRFSELKRSIEGITQRTLSQHLRELQHAGIVERTVYPDAPPRVVYNVTPLGESLRPVLDAMCHWGKSHAAAMALRKLRASAAAIEVRPNAAKT
jgi:DNA-binding HxlR family transcriptional regulator